MFGILNIVYFYNFSNNSQSSFKIVGSNNHHKDESRTKGNETSDLSEQNKSVFDVSHIDVDKLKQGKTKFFEGCSVLDSVWFALTCFTL